MPKKSSLAFILLLSGVLACGQVSFKEKLASLYQGTVPLITPEELESKLGQENLILLDTRSKEEYNVSHLNEAKFIDYDSFDSDSFTGISKQTKIIVYCSVGYRSERIGEQLQTLGYQVSNLYGGIFEWKNTGHAVVDSLGETERVHTYNENWSQWLLKGEKVYD